MKRKILFFYGFGLQPCDFDFLTTPEDEVVYRAFDAPLAPAEADYAIGYSLGVYALQLFLQHFSFQGQSFALYGSTAPLDAQEGIDPKAFRAFYRGLDPQKTMQFYQNIGYVPARPIGNFSDQLRHFSAISQPLLPTMDGAIIGLSDGIFSTRSLEKNFSKIRWKYWNTPHFPFLCWENWAGLIQDLMLLKK